MVALQVPLSMGFPRQEYWSVLPCPPPGDLPKPNLVYRDEEEGKGKKGNGVEGKGKKK